MRRLFRPLTRRITKGWIIVFLLLFIIVPGYVALGETRGDNAELKAQIKTEAKAHRQEMNVLKAKDSVASQAAMKEQIFLNEGISMVGHSFLFLADIDGEWEFTLPSGGKVVLIQETNGSTIDRRIEFYK